MSKISIKERISDAAEHFFAHKGYHSTSLRDITRAAKVNLAAVNYHFGSKENLLRIVIERRMIPINQIRLGRLRDIRETARKKQCLPGVEDLLRAFIEPTIEHIGITHGNMDFLAILHHTHMYPDEAIRNMFFKIVEPVLNEFLDAFYEALPKLPKSTVINRFLFAIGAMSHTLTNLENVEIFFEEHENPPYSTELRTITEELILFSTKGMEAL